MTKEEEFLIELGRRALKQGSAFPRSVKIESLEAAQRQESAASFILQSYFNEPKLGSRKSSKVQGELGFILQSYPWSETSLILEILTLNHGRITAVAKGAKRGTSPMRGLLHPFYPLKFTWTGRKEIKTLLDAQWMGTLAPIEGEALLSAFYVNELILKMTSKEDDIKGIFSIYVEVLKGLFSDSKEQRQRALRVFELNLLKLLGWELVAKEKENSSGFILIDGTLVGVNRGPFPGEIYYDKETVEAILREDFSKPSVMRQARDMLRSVIESHIGAQKLKTREVMNDITRFLANLKE